MTKNRLTIKETAGLMEASEQFVRRGLQQGIFPFGYAVKTSTHWTYFVSREKFVEHTGIRTGGRDAQTNH